MLSRIHLDHASRRRLLRKLRKMLNHPPCEIVVAIPGRITDRPLPCSSSQVAGGVMTGTTTITCLSSCDDLGQLYDRSNRVEALNRLAQLQKAYDGRWDYCPELEDLVRRWRRGHSEELDATMGPEEVTVVVALVMADLYHAVWALGSSSGGGTDVGGVGALQKQAMVLKPSEQAALQKANREWILGALDRANMSSSEREDEDVQLGRFVLE